MINEKIKEKIYELFNTTPDTVNIAYGKKTRNGEYTGELGIIFYVEKKKKLSELSTDEILPNIVEIDGKVFITDVKETGKIKFLSCPPNIANNCYSWTTVTPDNNNAQRPLKGGLGITSKNWAGYVGTMGLVCVDSATQSLVGLTNSHVVIRDAFYTTYRTPYGILENEIIDRVYQPASKVNDPNFEIGQVIRYQPMIPSYVGLNYIDCAVFSLKSDVIDITQSYKQFGVTGFTSPMEFATTSEIDNLLSTDPPLISSGRSSGVKEGSDCGIVVDALWAVVGTIANYLQGVEVPSSWGDGIIIKRPNPDCKFPIAPGDSGSALLANFGGTYKIIGLVYAGALNGDYGIACRIDRIASELGVEAWNGTSKNYINPDSIQIVTTGFSSSQKTITCSGKTFWQVGLTNYNNPCV
jgi:hypothetical protein